VGSITRAEQERKAECLRLSEKWPLYELFDIPYSTLMPDCPIDGIIKDRPLEFGRGQDWFQLWFLPITKATLVYIEKQFGRNKNMESLMVVMESSRNSLGT
jgi:hypothetical protein